MLSFRHTAALAVLAALGTVTTTARADLVSTLSTSAITAPASLSFSNSTVVSAPASTVSEGGFSYNFTDRYNFALAGGANITSIAVAFNVDAGLQSFGVSNLQITLVDTTTQSAPLFSWLTMATPVAAGISQVSALLPTASYAAGDSYALVVRGFVNQQGSYSGVLTATNAPAAVPLPAALPLLLAGFGALGAVARRRRPA